MKRLLSLCIICSLLCGVLSGGYIYAADLASEINENFDSMHEGIFSVPGWQLIDNISARGEISVIERKTNNMALKVEKYVTGVQSAKGFYLPFKEKMSPFTFEVELNGETASQLLYFFGSKAAPLVTLMFEQGKVTLYNSEEKLETAIGVKAGSWTALKVYVDPLNGTYSLYDGAELIAQNAAFRGERNGGIQKVMLSTGFVAEAASFFIDNLKLYDGKPKKEEAAPEQPSRVILDENFNKELMGDYTNVRWVKAGCAATITEEDGRGKVLNIIKPAGTSSTSGYLTNKMPDALSEPFTLEFEYFYKKNDKHDLMLYFLDAGNQSPSAISIFINRTQVSAFNGNKGQISTIPVPVNEWVKFQAFVNPAQQTFSVYINGKTAITEYTFRNQNCTDVQNIWLGMANVASEGQISVDNIKIYTGSPVIDGKAISAGNENDAAKKITVLGTTKTPSVLVGGNQSYPKTLLMVEQDYSVEAKAKLKNDEHDMYVDGKYSDVLASSRGYYSGEGANQWGEYSWGTLDMLKRFMATNDMWSYIPKPEDIAAIRNLGLEFQGAVNSTHLGSIEQKGKLFDGAVAFLPWLGPTSGSIMCMNSPGSFELLRDEVKAYLDNGATGIQFDDWSGNITIESYGGCFCDYCMEAFNEYLKENYTADDFAKWGININNFSYKKYVAEKYNVIANAEYLSLRSGIELYPVFRGFQKKTTRNFHQRLNSFVDEYTDGEAKITHNTNDLINHFTDYSGLMSVYDIFGGGFGETSLAALEPMTVAAGGYLSSALGKEYIGSPTPEGPTTNFTEKIRRSIALAYATGQRYLIPWDTYVGLPSSRYYATLEDIGGISHFVRQYPQLLDKLEVPAEIGLIVNLDTETSAGRIIDATAKLLQKGIPIKDIVSREKQAPFFKFDAEKLKGLRYLVAYSPLPSLPEDVQNAINASGIPVISLDGVGDDMTREISAVSVKNNVNMFSVLRSNLGNPDAPKVIHLVNLEDEPVTGLALTINDRFFFCDAERDVVLYRPNLDPLRLDVKTGADGTSVITVPEIKLWGIVRVCKKGEDLPEKYPFLNGWSGMNIGAPSVEYDSGTQTGDNAYTFYSRGKGFNVYTSGDEKGSQDQLSFIYQNLKTAPVFSNSVSARLESTGGAAGVMIRENVSSNARFVALIYDKNNDLRMFTRKETNGDVAAVNLGKIELPQYVKLEKRGSEAFAYTSDDGVDWGTPLAKCGVDFINSVVGVTAFNEDGIAAETRFADVSTNEGTEVMDGVAIEELITVMDSDTVVAKKERQIYVSVRLNSGVTVGADFLNVAYKSGNELIATVNKHGVIQGVSEGETEIKVSVEIGGLTAECKVAIKVLPRILTVMDENFELLDISDPPTGWTFANADKEDVNMKIVDSPNGGKALRAYDNATGTDAVATFTFPEAVDNDTIEINMDFMAESDLSNENRGATVFYTYSADGTNTIPLLVSATNFWYIDNGANTDIYPIEYGKWYHIKAIVNIPIKKLDMYIDDQLVVKGGNFRFSAPNIRSLTLNTNRNAVDTYSYWDNVSIKIVE